MKINPKLSPEQMKMLDRMRRAEVAHQARPAPAQVRAPRLPDAFAVADKVEVARDVAGTAFKAGQRGIILALHGLPAKIAEVELAGSAWVDTLCLTDLKAVV